MAKLSVIVPVYKVEKYLEKCIESILNQTLRNIELILVDDGSPDNCGEICDKYAQKDNRIKVIHQVNSGVSSARNEGLKIAVGDYIGFVDADDYIDAEMYEKMVSVALEKQVDVVICGVNYCDDKGKTIREDLNVEKYYTKEELILALFGKPNPIGGICWNKIFKRNEDEQRYFDENIKIAEDWIFLYDQFNSCKNGYQISNVLYNAVERSGSATRTDLINVMYNRINSCKILLDKTKKNTTEIEMCAVDKFLDDCIRYTKLMEIEAKRIGKSCFLKKMCVKYLMIIEIVESMRKKLLSKNKCRGYFIEMVKL